MLQIRPKVAQRTSTFDATGRSSRWLLPTLILIKKVGPVVSNSLVFASFIQIKLLSAPQFKSCSLLKLSRVAFKRAINN